MIEARRPAHKKAADEGVRAAPPAVVPASIGAAGGDLKQVLASPGAVRRPRPEPRDGAARRALATGARG